MRIYNSRRRGRRSNESRRKEERRTNNFLFGSAEWIENIQQFYLAWPKTDRRKQERRTTERRASDRRQRQLNEQQFSQTKYSPSILTHEERMLIEDLFRNEDA